MTKKELIDFADFHDGDQVLIGIIRQTEAGEEIKRVNTGMETLKILGLVSFLNADIFKQMERIGSDMANKKE